MKDRIQSAFDDIRADDALLMKTAVHLQNERAKHEKKHSRIQPLRFAGAIATVLALVVGIFGYRTFQSDAVAYVSIDVNPSVELVLNRLDKVISAVAYNADGASLLQQVEVSGRQYDEAVAALLGEMKLQGYISDDALVTLTVQTADNAKEQRLCNALRQSVGTQISIEYSAAEVEVFPVTQEVRETANGCHMSAAKYLAIQELMEVDEAATLEVYSESTIRQIRQRTRECRGEHASSSNDENQGGGYGQGSGPSQGGEQNQGSGHSQNGNQGHGGGHGTGRNQDNSHGYGGKHGGK